jgi:hypothetical protein
VVDPGSLLRPLRALVGRRCYLMVESILDCGSVDVDEKVARPMECCFGRMRSAESRGHMSQRFVQCVIPDHATARWIQIDS